MIESKSNRQIIEYLESEGAYVIKTIATNRAGTHDIIACLMGRFISVEGKSETGKSSALQENKAYDIWKAGGLAIVGARTVEDVAKALQAWKANGYKCEKPPQVRENLRFSL